jgi:hypothetical protein
MISMQTICNASACVGFTFPGMIDDPGSFAGRMSSIGPVRGPEPSQRMSLAILNSESTGLQRDAIHIDAARIGDHFGDQFRITVVDL